MFIMPLKHIFGPGIQSGDFYALLSDDMHRAKGNCQQLKVIMVGYPYRHIDERYHAQLVKKKDIESITDLPP